MRYRRGSLNFIIQPTTNPRLSSGGGTRKISDARHALDSQNAGREQPLSNLRPRDMVRRLAVEVEHGVGAVDHLGCTVIDPRRNFRVFEFPIEGFPELFHLDPPRSLFIAAPDDAVISGRAGHGI